MLGLQWLVDKDGGGHTLFVIKTRVNPTACCTLHLMVADRRFRQDLCYRISAFPIHLLPLRERAAEIPLLVDSFLQRGPRGDAAMHRQSVERQAMAQLQAHDWPGNIRELRNVLVRARLFVDDGIGHAGHLPESLNAGSMNASGRRPAVAERTHCIRKELARQAGLGERTLYRRLRVPGLA